MSYAPTWTALVTSLSNEVVARLAAAGMPPLHPFDDGTAGRILLGRQWVSSGWMPPKIVMVPTGFRTGPRSVVSPKMSAPDRMRELADRSIGTQFKQFEVHVWGCNFADQTTMAPDPDLDWDAVDALYNILWQSAQSIAAGVWSTKQGTIDKSANAWARTGRYAIFDLELATPILGDMTALPFAPSNVTGGLATYFQPSDGSPPEQGCST